MIFFLSVQEEKSKKVSRKRRMAELFYKCKKISRKRRAGNAVEREVQQRGSKRVVQETIGSRRNYRKSSFVQRRAGRQ